MKLCLYCARSYDTPGWHCPHCDNTPDEISGLPSFAPEFSADEGYKDTFFAELVELEARNFWFRARNRLIVWALKNYFPNAENILEIGCGTGFVLAGIEAACPSLKLFGCEISSAGLAHATIRVPKADLFQMDARAIPFLAEFDVIGACDVLEHIEDDIRVLDQMYQATRPGGGILLTVPQHDFLWSRMDDDACHLRRYDAKVLKKKVTDAGFMVERVTSFVSLLLPLMLATRYKKTKTVAEYDPLAELKISGFANTLLLKIMNLERQVIRLGINFPLGGSLMMIARKIP